VWEGLDPSLPSDVGEVLRELAYDLDFFEARRATRNEDGALYGHERLEREIRASLQKLREMGIHFPDGL
jgi:hypothetical protein